MAYLYGWPINIIIKFELTKVKKSAETFELALRVIFLKPDLKESASPVL